MNLLPKAKIRHKLGTEIKDLPRSIKEMSERRDRYMVTQVAAKPADVPVQNLRLSAMYKKAAELIGTEEKSNELIDKLIEGDEPSKKLLRTVSIVGFGGLGKTTLAKVVYDKLKGQFDCKAFVSVSENPNIERIFINMLRQLLHGYDKNVGTCDTQQLINEVRAFLQDKRYLIVTDDIWKTSVWQTIQYALVDNECGSIIISTTRNLDVADKIGGVYRLQPLSLTDSRKLFNLRIFGTEDKFLSNNLAEESAEILRKCGGVPLAIISIASTLASKKGMENMHLYWSKVCKTLGSGMEDSPDVEDMRRILAISYYDLPPHLKHCMLYLSSYPEDYVISTEELILKWMGEGFILKEQGRSFYEVGEDYFKSLQQLDVPYIYVESPSMLNSFFGLSELRRVRFKFKEWDEGYVKPFLQCLSSLVSLEYLEITGDDEEVCDFSCSPCDRQIIPMRPQQLQKIDMTDITVHTVPKWMSALSALTILRISLLTLGEEELHVLGSIPSLSHLFVYIYRGEELVISNAYPFLCLRKFEIRHITRVVFAQGAMPKLQTLRLGLESMESSMGQSGDFAVGFENLSSLVDVVVSLFCWNDRPKEELKAARTTIQNAVEMNQNKPSLNIWP